MTIEHRSEVSVAIDIGGTFTDVALFDRGTGRLSNAKVPTTPADPSIGFAEAINKAVGIAKVQAAAVGMVFHGTTVATNLILEGKGAVAGMVTSAGFKHVLEIGRHGIPRTSNMFAWIKPVRPVPPQRIHEVAGRLDHRGVEIEALDEAGIREAARTLRRQRVVAIAVCFLHSYVNPAHERRARDIILEEHPEALVSISSEVLPVFREYERSMTTILNVYVMPAVSTYVGRLEGRLQKIGIGAPLLLMKSSGGVTGSETVRREPVLTALSGPAAGVVGASFIGSSAGFDNIIGVDIGGTSADISLVRGGEPGMTTEGRIGVWPMILPMIDINTIGAGGGSIARVTGGSLKVGPESAGAQPGPVCYGCGGTEPTVTDAHLALGHLPPYLLNGEMTLDLEAARRAISERIARPLGLDLLEAARGILAVIDHNMVGAIRVVSVERGLDPREFVLVPFGGAGPLHGGSLARLLNIGIVLVPPAPGVLSALGLLVSNLKSEYSRTCLQRPSHYDLVEMRSAFAKMTTQGESWLASEGVPEAGRNIAWQASLRYEHQGFEVTVPWIEREVNAQSVAATIEAFHERHQELYTFAQRDTPVEIVTLRVTATGSLPKLRLHELGPGLSPESCIVGRSQIHFIDGTRSCPIYDRARLGAGARIVGPAIIQQIDTTTLLLPGEIAEVHRFGSLIVTEVQL
jgi:N-methylhydantoinase A